MATSTRRTIPRAGGAVRVNRAYYDVARTMGALQRLLVLKVAIPVM
jgi:hypothetical protein